MAGKKATGPIVGLATLTGRVDGLGLDYTPGPDQAGDILRLEEQAFRLGMRFLLAEFLGLPAAGLEAPPLPVQHALQESFFHESDWLLPADKIF